MVLKRLKKLRVNSYLFDVVWKKGYAGASVDYMNRKITVGVNDYDDEITIFEKLSHELLEMAMMELSVRLSRPDVDSDYIFVLDHRQFDALIAIYTGLITQFIT